MHEIQRNRCHKHSMLSELTSIYSLEFCEKQSRDLSHLLDVLLHTLMNRWTVRSRQINSHLVVIEEILERHLEVVSDSEVTPDW